MQEQKTDMQLIEQFKKGDQVAFEELVGRYSDKAYSLALRLTRNEEDAEEVLQDVFVSVFRKIRGFEGKSSFSSWLYRVTVNAAFMKLRKRKHSQVVMIDDVLPEINLHIARQNSGQHEADRAALRNQVSLVLEHAIGKLPDDYRPVFVLRDIDGLTSRQVGKVLNLTIPAVKSRLHRSRLMLRRKLARFFKEYLSGNCDSIPCRVGNG